MARIRTIKPEFFLDDELAKLHPLTRLLFIGLWCLADKAGRLEDKPPKIKVQVLPYDKHDIDGELTVLAQNGFINRYPAEGRRYIQVIAFTKHQRLHHTEKESCFPPCNGEITDIEPLKDGEKPSLARSLITYKGKEGRGVTNQKLRHGDAVMLTQIEFEKLVERYGEEPIKQAIEKLDIYVMSKGKKYSSHYHTILGWPIREVLAGKPTETKGSSW